MKKLTIISALSLSIFLSACAVTSAGVKRGDERNFSRSLNDVNIERVLKARLNRAESESFKKVDVEVAEGIVVLTGYVDSQDARVEAERIAWSASHVVDVGNEISVGVQDKRALRGTKDNLLGSSVRARLIADKSVKSRNVNIEAQNGTIYLLGVARTPEELERAAYIASTTKGVKEVVSYMTVHNSARPQTTHNTAPAYAPDYNSAPTYSAPSYEAPTYSTPTYEAPTYEVSGETNVPGFLTQTPNGAGLSAPTALTDPYYRDPLTGERVELDPHTGTIPFRSGAQAAIDNSAAKVTPLLQRPTEFPTDEALGRFRTGVPGEAVSIIESAPYYIDPDTGKEIPVNFIK